MNSVNNCFSGELADQPIIELGVDLEVSMEVDVNAAPVGDGMIRMDQTLDEIDAGVTLEVDLEAPILEVEVEADIDLAPEVEVDLEVQVEGKLFTLK